MDFTKYGRALACAGLLHILGSALAAAAPVITNVVAPSPQTYGSNSRPTIQVVFSEAVNVTGNPSLAVRIGSVDRQFANGYALHDLKSVFFTYTSQAGDTGSLNLTGPILLNGGTIKGDDGTDASLVFQPRAEPTVVFDTTPPAAPAVAAVTPASPTFEQSFVVTGTAEPGSRVYVGTADSRILSNGLTDANGNWSVSFNRQPAGTYTFQAKATDEAGNDSSPTPVTVTVQYDPPTPGVPTVVGVSTPSAGTYTDYEFSDTAHGVMGVSFRFSEKVLVTGNPTLVMRVGSTEVEFPAVPNGEFISFQRVPPSGLEGTLSVTGPIKLNGGSIKGYDGDDALLSFDPVDAPSVYIDTKHPADPVIGSVTPASPNSEQSFTIRGTAELGTRVYFSMSNRDLGSVATDANGNWSITLGPLAPGTYQILAYAVDQAGNWSRDRAPGIPVSGVPINLTVQPGPTGHPPITSQPASTIAGMGLTTKFTVATSSANATFQWQYNGTPITAATGSTLTIENTTPDRVGLYTAVVSDSGGSTLSAPALLGMASQVKLLGTGQEVGTNIVHPNKNVYDQVLLQGPAVTLTADPGQVTRASWVDLSGDIMQVEFSGAGTLSVVLEGPTGPAAAANYNQPAVAYMKGHAGLVITHADETTNVSVFSVGRITAIDQSIFRDGVTYDGVADLAFIAIQSANGNFGGLRAANASFWSTHGDTGIYAPNVTFTGPVYVGEITATQDATPVLLLGSTLDARVTGGDLAQTNSRAVQVSGLTQLRFVAGMTSQGIALSALPCRARLEENGRDLTAQLASP